ncbi:hypothetical protein [Pseudomonas sp. A2]|uniref:hypothetical protein n=1 Tax=Pseudomonas sp. A2 TaxID=107445 RepID=UPI001FFE741A|nr:hypothetical protein [Pseudomonas sp. A2]UPK87351.1 hypothetical protein E5221_21290 [Pseudomonas sp. A2]
MNSLASNPMLNIGLALMAQGRQGSAAQALGRGGMVGLQAVQQAQHQQALQQYRDQMMQVQQQQMQMRQQAAQAETERQRQYQQRLQDPNFLNSLSPMARQMAQLGVDPADLIRATNADNLAQHRQATLQQDQAQFAQRHAGAGGGSSGPRTPAPRPYIDQPVGNGMMQRHKYDAQTGDYAPWGEPFPQYSPGRKAATGADAATEAIMGAEAEPVPDTSALPGTGNLQSYAPGQQQAPIGVMPMAAQGGGAAVKPAPKAGMRVPGQAQIARPLTKADYDALPAGAQYIDPVSGKTATKRG